MNWRLYSWMRFTCGRGGKAGQQAWVGVCSQEYPSVVGPCGSLAWLAALYCRRQRSHKTLHKNQSVHKQGLKKGRDPAASSHAGVRHPQPARRKPGTTASQPPLCPPPSRYLDVKQRLGGDLVAGDVLDVRRQVGLLLLLDGAPAGAEAGVVGEGLQLLQQGGILHPGVGAQRLLSGGSTGGGAG